MIDNKILKLVAESDLVNYKWRGRGIAPIGYLKGMALIYAKRLTIKDNISVEMSKLLGDENKDALSWYELADNVSAVNRLRSLFALMIGLGMRESSGKFCEGRDQSANNVSANNAEAGLFQMSWDITNKVPFIKIIYDKALNEDGLIEVFREGVRCTKTNLQNFGKGAGADFQKMAKEQPAFAVEAAAIGLRNWRKHWGPINRREVEVRPEAIELLKAIEATI